MRDWNLSDGRVWEGKVEENKAEERSNAKEDLCLRSTSQQRTFASDSGSGRRMVVFTYMRDSFSPRE